MTILQQSENIDIDIRASGVWNTDIKYHTLLYRNICTKSPQNSIYTKRWLTASLFYIIQLAPLSHNTTFTFTFMSRTRFLSNLAIKKTASKKFLHYMNVFLSTVSLSDNNVVTSNT